MSYLTIWVTQTIAYQARWGSQTPSNRGCRNRKWLRKASSRGQDIKAQWKFMKIRRSGSSQSAHLQLRFSALLTKIPISSATRKMKTLLFNCLPRAHRGTSDWGAMAHLSPASLIISMAAINLLMRQSGHPRQHERKSNGKAPCLKVLLLKKYPENCLGRAMPHPSTFSGRISLTIQAQTWWPISLVASLLQRHLCLFDSNRKPRNKERMRSSMGRRWMSMGPVKRQMGL